MPTHLASCLGVAGTQLAMKDRQPPPQTAWIPVLGVLLAISKKATLKAYRPKQDSHLR